MGRKVFPIMVSTYEALCHCIDKNVEVLHVYWLLFQEDNEKVTKTLRDNGYRMSRLGTQWGMFFAKGIQLEKSNLPDSYHLF